MNNKVITLLVLGASLFGGVSGVLASQVSSHEIALHFNENMKGQHEEGMRHHGMGSQHMKQESNKDEHDHSENSNQNEYESPYVGQEERDIKALPPEDIEALKKGSGTPFGGMSKPAELNGVPGSKHLLDMIKAGKLEVTKKQKKKIKSVYQRMKKNAIDKGKQLIAVEKEIDNGFKNRTIDQSELKQKITKSADLYGELRYIHLKTHLEMLDVLDESQIKKYNKFRGYTDRNPCDKVPEGHDPDQWKKHNNC